MLEPLIILLSGYVGPNYRFVGMLTSCSRFYWLLHFQVCRDWVECCFQIREETRVTQIALLAYRERERLQAWRAQMDALEEEIETLPYEDSRLSWFP